MFIVPFICKVSKQHNMTIYSIHILTIGGTQLWEEEDHLRTQEDVLEPNDIYSKANIRTVDTLRLCEVDTDRTHIADFYKWSELPAHDRETFCWRDFYYIAGHKQDTQDSWLDIPSKERLGSISVAKLVRAILETV